MNLHLSPKRDKPDESVIRQQAHGTTKCGFEKLHFLLDETRVKEEKKHGRGISEGIRNRKVIIDGGVLRVEFAGEVGFGDGVVMRGKVVALVTERTDPDLGSEIDAGERVECGGAGFATERGVAETGNVGVGPD